MKNILILLWCLILPILAIGQSIEDHSSYFAKRRDSINNALDSKFLHKEKDGKLFTGIDSIIQKDKTDSFLVISTYTNGVLNKEESFYLENNAKRNEITYMTWRCCFGVAREWYKSGKLKREEYCGLDLDPRWQNPFCEWYENGNKKKELVFDSLNYLKEWYENGQLEHEIKNITNPMFSNAPALERRWCPDGTLYYYEYHHNGRSPFVYYNCETKHKIAEFYCIDNIATFVGKVVFWYPNGKINEVNYYRDTDKYEEANYRIGIWKYWDENGNLIRKEKYKKNKLVWRKEYKKTL